MSRKILVVSGFFPFPTFHGGTFDIWERIKGLKKLGHEIDLLYTDKNTINKDDLNYVKSYVKDVYEINRTNNVLQLFNINPLQVISRKGLKKVTLQKKYDAVILETEYVASVIQNPTLKADKIIVRIQNNEYIYFQNLAKSTTSFLKKIYYYQESIKFYFYSKRIYNKADRLWFISLNEEENYKKNYKATNSVHLPSPINTNFIKRKLDNNNVLFLGSLFMENNLEGILWYLNNVHDKICSVFDDYTLYISGSTGDFSEEYFIKKFEKYDKIKIFFDLKSLDEMYESTSVFINPMLHGAGVKLKSINAIVNGLPLVATAIGSEGIGLKDKEMFLLADTAEEYISSLVAILKSQNKQEIVNAAQNYLKAGNYLNVIKSELV